MLYLGQKDILSIKRDWHELIEVICQTIHVLAKGDFAQPLKPYLRYKNLKNRIIAMPSYVGGEVMMSGIKWIASFPENIQKGLPRAHSVTILNDADTGQPLCIINTAEVSVIRTSSVSGVVLRKYLQHHPEKTKYHVGIIGFGPIGRSHLEMIVAVVGEKLGRIFIFDMRGIRTEDLPPAFADKISVVNDWREAYFESDIFVTATASTDRYIDAPPKKGALLLNVSLRDFRPECFNFIDHFIVDDWTEVCRENTDIEAMHKQFNLTKEDVFSLLDFPSTEKIDAAFGNGSVVMFNPMGMASFDIAIAKHYYQTAVKQSVGTRL